MPPTSKKNRTYALLIGLELYHNHTRHAKINFDSFSQNQNSLSPYMLYKTAVITRHLNHFVKTSGLNLQMCLNTKSIDGYDELLSHLHLYPRRRIGDFIILIKPRDVADATSFEIDTPMPTRMNMSAKDKTEPFAQWFNLPTLFFCKANLMVHTKPSVRTRFPVCC